MNGVCPKCLHAFEEGDSPILHSSKFYCRGCLHKIEQEEDLKDVYERLSDFPKQFIDKLIFAESGDTSELLCEWVIIEREGEGYLVTGADSEKELAIKMKLAVVDNYEILNTYIVMILHNGKEVNFKACLEIQVNEKDGTEMLKVMQ